MRKMTSWLACALVAAAATLAWSETAAGFGRHRDCPPPCPPQTVILTVCHPCTGCQHDILVCIPACIPGAPCAHFERTLIGAGRTVFEWPGGYCVIVRHQNGGGYRVVQRD